VIASLQACASGGGFLLKNLVGNLGRFRPGETLWMLGGPALTLVRGRRAVADPLCAASLVCLPVTVLLLAGEGIHINHLIDASAVGALAVGAAVLDPRLPRHWWRAVVAGGTVFGLAEAVLLDGMLIKHGELQQTLAALPAGSAPLLAEHPWIPLLAGERPFILDAFSVTQTRPNVPRLDHDLLDRLDHCAFGAVVLLGCAERAADWCHFSQFGPGFREHLLAHYAFREVAGAQAIYLPHCESKPVVSAAAIENTETIVDRGGRPSVLSRLFGGH